MDRVERNRSMILFDISIPLSPSTPTFPGDPKVRLENLPGDFAVTRLEFGSHSGTHLDIPGHLGIGGPSGDRINLEELIGPCLVYDLTGHAGPVDRRALADLPAGGPERLLLKTGNSRLWRRGKFVDHYQALTADGAACLVERGIRLLGMDYLSVESCKGGGEVHRLLLEAGMLVLEGIDLAAVEAGVYELICLPLKLAVADGVPCRAVLRRD
jgi:arylformamidase